MRRFISVLPALGLSLVLAACGDKPGPAAATTSAPSTQPATTQSPASTEADTQGRNDMIKECSGVRLHLSALPSESGGSTKTHRNGA